jgi:hypothetical protein
MSDRITDVIALAKQIDQRAAAIARGIEFEIAANCAGKPEFMVIMLEAVERKVMAMRHEVQRKAAGLRGRS